jgi:hypothetical protein
MSEWITDRLPTAEDGIADRVIVWDDDKGPMLWMYNHVSVGQPWMSIHCKPYVKKKRWTLWKDRNGWSIGDGKRGAAMIFDLKWREPRFFMPASCIDLPTAQRICDILNEVMP